MKIARTNLFKVVFTLVIYSIVYGIAIIGDFVLMRKINNQVDAIGGEGRRIMNDRYQMQDLALIAAAEREGYQYRILLPSVIEKSPKLQVLSTKFGFAPLGLEANKKLSICNEGDGLLKLSTDRFGFRNLDSVWNTTLTNRFVLVGDSFAFGLCQQHQNSLVGHLGSQFNIVNLSFPGATAVHYAAMIKIFQPRIKADKVVLIFYANDNMSVQGSQHYHDLFFGPQSAASRYFDQSGVLMPAAAHQDFYQAVREEVQHQKDIELQEEKGNTNSALRRIKQLFSHYSFPGARTVFKAYRSSREDGTDSLELAVGTLRMYCQSTKCKPLVVYIPNSQFWDPDGRSAEFAASVANTTEKYGISFIDLSNEINRLGADAYSKAGIHLSGSGYALVAGAIRDYFSREKAGRK